MKILNIFGAAFGAVVGLAAAAWLAPAHATDLIVVNQSMLRFVCLFVGDCSNSIAPSNVGALPPSQLSSDGRLESIVFEAKPDTPAVGTTAYVYRVDLSKVTAHGECLAGLVINFGPPARIPSDIGNAAHVFVITTEGHGTVAVKSAEQDGDFIQFNFNGAVCVGQSSMFFGLASEKPPVSSEATLFGYGSPPIIQTTAQTPRH